jgi:hypothetical protein
MRTILSFPFVLGAVIFGSAQSASAPKSNWLSDSATRTGSLVEMHGHVRIATCGIITADDATGGPEASETVLSGNVHLKLTNGVDPLQ